MSRMDENRPAYRLKAPGSRDASSAMRLPGRSAFPRVDDHLVKPEITRDEIIGGQRVVASPAHPPHATQHVQLDYLVRAHAAPGFQAASDLLTRHDEESDFATDSSIYRLGVDPETGARYLEEIAFEVVSEQNQKLVTEKARRMSRRGVRRIFSVWVKGRQRVSEWSHETESWRRLELDERIEDPCLVAPLSVAALLDAAAADDAVVGALVAKGNPEIRQREAAAEAKGKTEGRAEGTAEAILRFLEARGIAVKPTQRQQILICQDADQLDHWLCRAAVASSADEVFSGS